MKRSGPLRRRTPLRSTKPIARESEKSRARRLLWTSVRKRVLARDNDRCVVGIDRCTMIATQVHHVWRRSQGGPDEEWNLISICGPCHRYVHDNVAWAKDQGFLRDPSG